ncbi:MAG: TldD/PmbA family protein [SAR324 cluster bacterium]|nr:TldD/PmbA family protein [SAR324 cluster bacterium]
MEPEAAVDFVRSLAREHREKDVDLVLERQESLAVRVHKGRVEKVDQSTARGLGIRIVNEGRTGIAFTERLETHALEQAFLAAKENATLLDPTEVVMAEPPADIPHAGALGVYNPELESLTVADLEAAALEMESRALQADSRVTAVSRLAVYRSASERRLVSVHGVDYRQRQNSVGGYCQALLEENGSRKSGSYFWNQRHWDPAAIATVGETATKRGADLLGAKPIAGGRLPVVLDPDCAPDLLSFFFGSFSGEAAQKGRSRLKGKLGQVIADEAIDLEDDPHRRGAGGSSYLDAEGIPTRRIPLIESGRFANFLYHIESARKEGTQSTGHAGRGYTGGISTTSHNLVMPLGNESLDDLTAIPEKCLLVTELEGGAGCNSLSGDISIGVQGFWVENGRRVHPVDSVTLAGNFFDLLKAIRARGNAYQPNLSRRFIPALLVDGLVVSS